MAEIKKCKECCEKTGKRCTKKTVTNSDMCSRHQKICETSCEVASKKIKILIDDEDRMGEIIKNLSLYFDSLPQGEPKIYFSGEFDSQQSDFEEKSNNLDVGVICGNKELAY